MKEAVEQDTNEVIYRKLELGRLINKLKNPKSRSVLRMTYITKTYIEDICDNLRISKATYYRLRKQAEAELEEIIIDKVS